MDNSSSSKQYLTKAYYVLGVVTVLNVINLWHRYLLAENSSSESELDCLSCRKAHGVDFYNLKDGACIDNSQYGVLAGVGFTLTFALATLVAGRFTDIFDKRLLHTGATLVWSLAAASHGSCNSFRCLLIARILIGIGQAFHAPACYALIAMYFHDSRRATANGIYCAGNYLGAAMSSLCLAIAGLVGWRETAYISGAFGVIMAVVLFLTVDHHPENLSPRERFSFWHQEACEGDDAVVVASPKTPASTRDLVKMPSRTTPMAISPCQFLRPSRRYVTTITTGLPPTPPTPFALTSSSSSSKPTRKRLSGPMGAHGIGNTSSALSSPSSGIRDVAEISPGFGAAMSPGFGAVLVTPKSVSPMSPFSLAADSRNSVAGGRGQGWTMLPRPHGNTAGSVSPRLAAAAGDGGGRSMEGINPFSGGGIGDRDGGVYKPRKAGALGRGAVGRDRRRTPKQQQRLSPLSSQPSTTLSLLSLEGGDANSGGGDDINPTSTTTTDDSKAAHDSPASEAAVVPLNHSNNNNNSSRSNNNDTDSGKTHAGGKPNYGSLDNDAACEGRAGSTAGIRKGSGGGGNGVTKPGDVFASEERWEVEGLWDALQTIKSSRATLLLYAATSVRMVATWTLASYLAIYFGRAFPSQTWLYSVCNAVFICAGGVASSYAGGVISDRLRVRSEGFLGYVPAFGATAAIPPVALVLFSRNFSLSMAGLLFTYLVGECWPGPVMAVMQREVPKELTGTTVAILLFLNSISCNMGPWFVAWRDTGMATVRTPMFVIICASYVLSAALFCAVGVSVTDGKRKPTTPHMILPFTRAEEYHQDDDGSTEDTATSTLQHRFSADATSKTSTKAAMTSSTKGRKTNGVLSALKIMEDAEKSENLPEHDHNNSENRQNILENFLEEGEGNSAPFNGL